MTPAEAFAALALVAVACDGSLNHQEAHSLRQQLEQRSPYRAHSEERMGAMFDALLEQLRRDGWKELLRRALPQLTPQQQETGLAMAAQLVHCDRVVRSEEQEMLAFMAEASTLDPLRCDQILEVIALLNRDSLAA